MGSGYAAYAVVAFHFSHLLNLFSSPRHIPSSIMFFATSQLSPLSSTDHVDYDHVWSECVWSQSTHIDEQRQPNTHSDPMTTWPAATHSGSIQLGTHKAKSHSPTGPRADFVRGSCQISGSCGQGPHNTAVRLKIAHFQQTRSLRGRETRPLVAEKNSQIGSSLRHSVRDCSQQTRPLVAERQQHCNGMLRQFLSKRFWVFPVSPCT